MIIIEAAAKVHAAQEADYLSRQKEANRSLSLVLSFLLIATDIPFSPRRHYIHQKRRCLSASVSQKFPRSATGTIRQNLSLCWVENAASLSENIKKVLIAIFLSARALNAVNSRVVAAIKSFCFWWRLLTGFICAPPLCGTGFLHRGLLFLLYTVSVCQLDNFYDTFRLTNLCKCWWILFAALVQEQNCFHYGTWYLPQF